ncbi:MAG: hypothetical protein J6U54_03650 [Clostridiales bacterium]|nr:hypothetical protein [Clostridiales bacterium]
MMPSNKDYTYYAVMEESTPADAKAEILDEHKLNGELSFLRFRQCLQSFGQRNRNKRLWQASHIRDSLKHPWVVQHLEKKGGLPGENGHPSAESGELSMERLCKIDPNNICLLLKSYTFENNDKLLFGVVETIDDGNGPGNRLMRNILQGIQPAVSCRTLVPQKKNPDGTIDVMGPGRLICYDRVFTPSHEEAFMDVKAGITAVTTSLPKKSTTVVESPAYECALKDLKDYAFKSDTTKHILDGLDVCMEDAFIDNLEFLSVPTNEGHVFIPLRQDDRISKKLDAFMRGSF